MRRRKRNFTSQLIEKGVYFTSLHLNTQVKKKESPLFRKERKENRESLREYII
jgi:hypothetical protein